MALTTLLAIYAPKALSQTNAAEDKNLQLKLGEAVSVYSEKAYRKGGGNIFEAIGNVIILSGKETLYGEKASLNIGKGMVEVEGNVRFISKDITLYGSKVKFNTRTGELEMQNARIVTSDFNVVADQLVKKGPELYYAKEAEFTTCKDCTESWSIYGEEIYIQLNQYARIYHALAKIKGIHVLYIPFIALPIKTKRESGLLFPYVSSRVNEGVSFQQPVYWAIDDSKDFTLSPSFWGVRGYGTDLQYRQAFADKSYLEYDHRLLEDRIYEPYKTSLEPTGQKYFRQFYNIENHMQWSNSLTQHILATGTKDLDMFRDFTPYTDQYLLSSSIGLSMFLEKRFMDYSLGVEADYRRNLLVSDPTEFDKTYVQTLPSVYFNLMPQSLYHSDKLFLQNISAGMDSDYTVFKQMERDEAVFLRNVGRISVTPYLHWHFFNYGPLSFGTKFTQYFQHYNFSARDEDDFQKSAGLVKTELSFSMDRIFGLAFEEKVSLEELGKDQVKEVFPEREQSRDKDPDLVGSIPDFEASLTDEAVTVVKNSYRHSQDFKFIHYFINNSVTSGNDRFSQQIGDPEGWFDYSDARLEDQGLLGVNQTRKIIPKKNTLEFQWNNLLIRKSPKAFNYFEDQRYLRDNFNYTRVGFFKVSQGFLLDQSEGSFNEKLTRLYVSAGYNAPTWNLGFNEWYFHVDSEQITELNFQKKFDKVSGLVSYNSNTLPGSVLKSLRLGGQVRPVDAFGFSVVGEFDLDAEESLRTIYQADIMPDNNCWILNFGYRKSVVDQRYSVNFVLNFGSDEFKNYRNNYFSFNRLSL